MGRSLTDLGPARPPRLDVALDVLRDRRARAAERADELMGEIDRVDGTPAAIGLRSRLESVVALIDQLDAMIARRVASK
jgi:hypothetical protein